MNNFAHIGIFTFNYLKCKCCANIIKCFSPVFCEECSDRIAKNLALVVDISEDIFGPFHEVSDLVAW